MPRWAEGLIAIVVGIVFTGALMVYAKWSSRAEPTPAPAVAEQAPTAPTPSARPSPLPEPEAPPLPDPSLSPQPSPSPSPSPLPSPLPSPVPTPPLPAEGPVALVDVAPISQAEAAAAGIAVTTFNGGQAPASNPSTTPKWLTEPPPVVVKAEVPPEAPPPPEVVPSATAVAAPSSKEELTVLEEATKSLQALHNLRIRPDLPPAVAQAEMKKLTALLDKLSPETRKTVRDAIAQGYERRAQGPNRKDDVDQRGAGAADLDRADAGRQRNETPSDVKALSDRIAALRQHLGVTVKPAPTRTERQPTAREIPSVEPEGEPSEEPE